MSTLVIVVGGGPNGLMLAGELALRGVRVVPLERLVRQTTAARANGLAGEIVRLMDQRGLYSGLSRAGRSRLPSAARMGLLAQRRRPTPVRRYQYGGFDLDLR